MIVTGDLNAGELLGLPDIPAFMETIDGGVDVLRGVNYASAAGGILEETGRHLVRIHFNYFIIYFLFAAKNVNIISRNEVKVLQYAVDKLYNLSEIGSIMCSLMLVIRKVSSNGLMCVFFTYV